MRANDLFNHWGISITLNWFNNNNIIILLFSIEMNEYSIQMIN